MKIDENSITFEKSKIGVNIVKEFLEKEKWVIMQTTTKSVPTAFDMIAIKDKSEIVINEVKVKARMNKWPAQGIDKFLYFQYIAIANQVNVPFYLWFVCDKTGNVHKALLTDLHDPIFQDTKIIAWNLDQMELMFNIGPEQIQRLTLLDSRNYEFKPAQL